jgi:hypothetical protein
MWRTYHCDAMETSTSNQGFLQTRVRFFFHKLFEYYGRQSMSKSSHGSRKLDMLLTWLAEKSMCLLALGPGLAHTLLLVSCNLLRAPLETGSAMSRSRLKCLAKTRRTRRARQKLRNGRSTGFRHIPSTSKTAGKEPAAISPSEQQKHTGVNCITSALHQEQDEAAHHSGHRSEALSEH